MEPYPRRDSHFAHRFVRVLHKSCAAQDIGTQACYLLCVIAHTEDAARYRGPARFWNSQLMETLGFTSPKQLDNARDAAIEAGWLHYDRAGNRQVGEYFVTIPNHFIGINDAPIEPLNHSPGGTNNGKISGTKVKRKRERIGNGSRNESETESGKPPIPLPVPIPVPIPKEEGAAVAASPCSVKGKEILVPENINTTEARAALAEWLAYKRSRGQGYKATGHIEKKLAELAPAGPAAFIAAVNHCIGSNYDGLFPAKETKNGKPSTLPIGPGQRHDASSELSWE